MKQEYHIELIEEHELVNFYSIHLEEEELSELERFFEKFPEGCAYDNEIDIIISWLDKIGENGALERYFRPEGKYGDGVGVIPINVGNKLRLYCLRLSENILVFVVSAEQQSRNVYLHLLGHILSKHIVHEVGKFDEFCRFDDFVVVLTRTVHDVNDLFFLFFGCRCGFLH